MDIDFFLLNLFLNIIYIVKRSINHININFCDKQTLMLQFLFFPSLYLNALVLFWSVTFHHIFIKRFNNGLINMVGLSSFVIVTLACEDDFLKEK